MPSSREQGFALLIVLWTMVLLALLVTGIMGTGRTEAKLASNLQINARLRATADGAIYDVVFQEMTKGTTPARVAHGAVRILVEDEAGKINPNTASPQLLRSLLRHIGVEDGAAASLAAAIADWRDDSPTPSPGGAKAPQYIAAGRNYGPPQEPFQSIGELSNVLGMTPAILNRLAPHLSIYSTAQPQLSTADPVVAAALRDVAEGQDIAAPAPAASRILSITATVVGPGDARATRHADVRIATDDHGPGYAILTWTIPATY
jgi:general secretion pathway protein K